MRYALILIVLNACASPEDVMRDLEAEALTAIEAQGIEYTADVHYYGAIPDYGLFVERGELAATVLNTKNSAQVYYDPVFGLR